MRNTLLQQVSVLSTTYPLRLRTTGGQSLHVTLSQYYSLVNLSLGLKSWSKGSLPKLQKVSGFAMGKTCTILSNRLDAEVLNNELIKGKTWPGNRTSLNRGSPKNKKANIQRSGFKGLPIKYRHTIKSEFPMRNKAVEKLP